MAVIDPHRLLESLCALPRETEWLEFKLNRFDAEEVGRYISALANSAIFEQQERGYLVFGVSDHDHEVIGTNVRLKAEKVGGDVFENWLARMMNPRINLEFISLTVHDRSVEMIIIDPGYISPVRFQSTAYIRIDSVQKLLGEYPERERVIWAITSRFTFERGIAVAHLSQEEIFNRFECAQLFNALRNSKLSRSAMLDHLLMEQLLVDNKQGGFDATNLLTLVAGHDLSEFPLLAKKAPRVIAYKGPSKLHGVDDVTGRRGYAVSFPKLMRYVMDRIPHREEIEHGVRRTKYSIPEMAVREIIANAMIHQDLTSRGDGPLVEIFEDKLRVTNPGKPLVSPDRFIDAPAKSRNEQLAGMMRRLGFCEERGSGIDRALDAIERQALPPPIFAAVEDSTVVTLFRERPFAAMSKDERIRACYQHASLRFEVGSPMNNASLRRRFGLNDKQYPQVSNVIRDAQDAGLIRPLDEGQSNRVARYIPWWAGDFVIGSQREVIREISESARVD